VKRFQPTTIHFVLLSIVAISVVGVLLSRSTPVNAGAPSSTSVPGPRGVGPPSNPGPAPYTGQLGTPAIQPRADLASSSGARFTEADVRQYFASHRPPGAVAGSPAPTIVSIQFLTAQDVSQQLQGESMGVPDDTLLCLVRLSGTFLSAQYGPPNVAPSTTTRSQAEVVFDAHTGNEIVTSA
jgi:hypothetical protein